MADIAPNRLGYRDARGQVGRVSFYINLTAGTLAHAVTLADAVRTAISALTNGVLVTNVGLDGSVADPGNYGVNQAYPNAEDKARIWYLMQDYTLSHIDIPAPVGTGGGNIFQPDGETVKTTATTVAALTTALLAVGAGGEFPSNKAGAGYLAVVGGIRRRNKFQRKLTIWTKDPTLSIPDE